MEVTNYRKPNIKNDIIYVYLEDNLWVITPQGHLVDIVSGAIHRAGCFRAPMKFKEVWYGEGNARVFRFSGDILGSQEAQKFLKKYLEKGDLG